MKRNEKSQDEIHDILRCGRLEKIRKKMTFYDVLPFLPKFSSFSPNLGESLYKKTLWDDQENFQNVCNPIWSQCTWQSVRKPGVITKPCYLSPRHIYRLKTLVNVYSKSLFTQSANLYKSQWTSARENNTAKIKSPNGSFVVF